MSNINISTLTDKTPNIFQLANFNNAEAVTSAKLNVFSTQINNQFGVLSEAVGNVFVHGIPNLAGALGDLGLLTQPIVNSNDLIGAKSALFNSSNTAFNDMQCVVGSVDVNGQYPIAILSGGVISQDNIIGTSGIVPVINVAIVKKNGSGAITTVYPGSFSTPASYAGGSVSQFNAVFGDVIVPGSDFYVIASNYSVATVLAEAVTNIGDLQYGRLNGYVDINDTIQTLSGLPTLTAEINATENKNFAVKWHAVLQASGGVISGINRVWTSTASATTWQTGSMPSPTSVQSYVSTMAGSLVIPANATIGIYMSGDGATVLDSSGNIVIPTITYTAGTITISVPLTVMANITVSNIDVYFPALIPLRLLQANNIDYSEEGARVPDLMRRVIGRQYGWNTLPYPDTVGNRLDSHDSSIDNLNSLVTSIGDLFIPNGSFETVSGGIPLRWTPTTLTGGTFAVDTTLANTVHGGRSVKFTAPGGGGNGGGYITSNRITINPFRDLNISFFTKSTIATAINKAEVIFVDNNLVQIDAIPGTGGSLWNIWSDSATNTVGYWKQVKITINNVFIPSNCKYIQIRLTGANTGSAASNVWFESVELWTQTMSIRDTAYWSGQFDFGATLTLAGYNTALTTDSSAFGSHTYSDGSDSDGKNIQIQYSQDGATPTNYHSGVAGTNTEQRRWNPSLSATLKIVDQGQVSGAGDVWYFIGNASGTPGPVSNGVHDALANRTGFGIFHWSFNTANWRLVYNNGSSVSSTIVDTGIPVLENALYKIQMALDDANGVVAVRINGNATTRAAGGLMPASTTAMTFFLYNHSTQLFGKLVRSKLYSVEGRKQYPQITHI